MHIQQFNSLLLLTGRELLRTRAPWLVLMIIASAYALAEFAASLAITESHAHRVVFYAATVRIGLVAALCLVVISNVVRDDDDRLLELMLSRPLSREAWMATKCAGYVAGAVCAAALAALPLLLWCPAQVVIRWLVSLGSELALISVAAAVAAFSLAHVALASAALGAFYLLGRTIDTLVLLSEETLLGTPSVFDRVAAAVIRWVSYVIPNLAEHAPTAWLVYDAPTARTLATQLGAVVLYAVLLLVVGIIDFKRRRG